MKSVVDPSVIISLRNSGHTYEEIEKQLGINRSTLHGIVWRHIGDKKKYIPKPKAEPKRTGLPDRRYHPIWENET